LIPVTLRLENFLSYREMAAPLDLTGVELACLSGANGHGKSSLLDAITWVIWGRARGAEGGQEQERLIHDGAETARVELVFLLDGVRHRLIRERSRSGKATLEFSIGDGGDGWTDLTGEGIRETQDKIDKHFRMDYETFVASAFIMQGESDRFSRLKPAERKQALARVLGVEIYEAFAERAKERKKEAASEAETAEAFLEQIQRDLDTLPDIEREHEQASRDAATAGALAVEVVAAHATALTRVSTLEAAERASAELRKAAETAARRVRDTEKEIETLDKHSAELQRLATTDPVLAERAAAREEHRLRVEALESARLRHDQLAAEERDLRARIDNERVKIEAERKQVAKGLAGEEAKLAAEPEITVRLANARARSTELDAVASRVEALSAEGASVLERASGLKASATRRSSDLVELAEKTQLLSHADAACPLCGEPLDAAHRSEIVAELAAQKTKLDAEEKETAKALSSLQTRATEINSELAAFRKELAQRDAVVRAIGQATESLERIAEARTAAAAARDGVARLDGLLAREEYAPTERNKLASTRAEIATVGYDPAAYEVARRLLDSSVAASESLVKAQAAAARLEDARTTRAQAAERLAAFVAEREAAERAHAGAAAGFAGLPDARAALTELNGRLNAAREASSAAMARVATAATAIERLGGRKTDAAEARGRVIAAKQRQRLYDKLAKAFGRDGIPARIIGNAVPELQREANELLNLLSDGRLTISIESLRRMKTGKDKESLDITVYDGGERRPYDMYSGGERLRIDFALRVALSRLLVHRAGARLETLVIDEGFGSQDAEGRARLIEAIHRVKDSFALILVMTHMDDIKDQFPVRIEVTKDPNRGSEVRVA
jgi:DNA repair protein SbcC/Rad50